MGPGKPSMSRNEPLSAHTIFVISVGFALLGLVAYGSVITHPDAEELVRWAQIPISTVSR
jgi:hypothetical protein